MHTGGDVGAGWRVLFGGRPGELRTRGVAWG